MARTAPPAKVPPADLPVHFVAPVPVMGRKLVGDPRPALPPPRLLRILYLLLQRLFFGKDN